LSAEGDGLPPILDRCAEMIGRAALRCRRAPTINSTYRGQIAATVLAATQIPAHNPSDNSVIAVSDAILLSRTAAGRSARSASDGR
jgi:hypothetical protein